MNYDFEKELNKNSKAMNKTRHKLKDYVFKTSDIIEVD